MNQACFQSSAWYKATTLTERIKSLSTIGSNRFKIEINAELSQRKMQRWKSQSPFSNGSYFAQRLAIDGITEDDFFYILSEPISAVKDRFPNPQNWLTEIAEAFFILIPVQPHLQRNCKVMK